MAKNKITSEEFLPKSLSSPNVEYSVGFLQKMKKFLIKLWQNLVDTVRIVKDHYLHYFRGDQIERIRLYHVWPGNNVFFLRGFIICGPHPRALLLTVGAISLCSWIFAVHVASDLPNRSSIIICSLILTIIVIANMGMVGMIDPGIIPRNKQPSSEFDVSEKERSKQVMVNGIGIKLKYCHICNIIRPPRCCHCAICDNCIEKFDHHCPWLGQCIGLRNYRLYIMVLLMGLVVFVYMFVFSSQSIRNWISRSGSGLVGLVRDCPEMLMLAIFTFATSLFLGCIASYHVYLLAINQTAYEKYREKYVSSENPYEHGVVNNIKEVMLAPWPTSRVNFRAEVCSGGLVHQESTSGQVM